jgi:hypothetical protein
MLWTFYYLAYLSFFFTIATCYIDSSNWKILEKQFSNEKLPQVKRLLIEKYVFKNYLPLAYSETMNFINFHKYKTKFIHNDDLYFYGLIGLYHATRKYNGKSNFYKYAQTYINGSLYKCLTVNYPLSKKTRNERRKKQKYIFGYDEIFKDDNNYYLGKRDFVKNTNIYKKDFTPFENVWTKIMLSENFRDKMIMKDKFDIEFNKLKSNKELSVKYKCSEETIRKTVFRRINNVTKNNEYNI